MSKYDEIIKKLEDIGFKVKEEYDLDSQYIVLERTVEQYNTHQTNEPRKILIRGEILETG
jgi:hypothetical protein